MQEIDTITIMFCFRSPSNVCRADWQTRYPSSKILHPLQGVERTSIFQTPSILGGHLNFSSINMHANKETQEHVHGAPMP